MNTPKEVEIIFATHNKNKLEEIRAQIPRHIKLLSLTDIGCTEDIPETSGTIEGNAFQKAQYVKENYGLNCFADDTGLEVEALNGAPGVLSARYAGEEKNDEANIQKLLNELKGNKNRKARFKTVIALILEEEEFLFTGICPGSITTTKTGEKGFGYDPVFQPEEQEKTFAQMSMVEKAAIGHRGKAVQKLLNFLSK